MAGMAYTPVQQNGERTPYGGGAGKMRARRAPKRNGTPYDRPAQGRHASAGPQAAALMAGANADGAQRDGWLGARLLGTASKIVTSSASYLYSSFFKRPAGGGALLLTDVEKPPADNVEGQVDMLSPSAAEAESMEAGSQHGEEDKSASEVESWMKRTFPREEADRLIASLRSYVKDNDTVEEQTGNANNEEQRRTALPNQVPALESAPSNGQLSDAQRWREERTKARQEQKSNLWVGGPAKENGTSTGAGPSETGEIVAVDVARAYMGERVTRVVTPARVTLTREKVRTPMRLSSYQPSPYLLRKQQGTSMSSQHEPASVATPFGLPAPLGVHGRQMDENLRTPPLSRTVGRLLPAARTNVPSSAIGYPLPGEGTQKRRSAALEDGGYSSVGPERRVRHRSSLYTPSPASGFSRRGGLGIYPPPPRIIQTPVDAKQKAITMWSRNADTDDKRNVVNAQHEKEESRVSGVGANASVPERASATARKILETLDMMTPSPKDKSLDTELALVRERPPTELTTSMINDKARQTMQSWDFPGPQDSEEAGPSGRGRNLENDLSSAAGFSWKGAEQGTKARGKGKAPASTPSHAFEEKNADHPSFSFQDTSRSKVSESSLPNPSPAVERSKGFQINADVDDSDEETRGAGANLLTTNVTSTISFTTGKSAPSGAGLFDNNSSRSLNVTAPMFGAPVTVESQRTTSETTLIEGKSNLASGGFTFPSSNPFGSSLEAPPTPKPFPSPSNMGAAAKPNGFPAYKFNTGPQVFKLPGGGDSAQVGELKFNYQLDSKSDSLPSIVSVPETSQPFSTNPSESTRGAALPSLSSSGAEIPTPSTTSTTFTSSTISLANFGAPGAGAKPVFAGIFNQTTSLTGSSSAQVTTSTSNVDTSIFNFGKAPSSSPSSESATLTSASAGDAPSLFGSSTVASSTATTTSPVFGSSATFGSNKSPFSFGAAASSAPAAPIQTTAPSATSDDGNRPQKRMFGQEQTPTGDVSAAPTVSFGLSAAATTSTSAPAGSGFTVPAFGQGASSSSPATSLFGLKPASTDSTPSTSSSPSPSLGTGAFGSSSPFGSSTFGSSNATPLFGGASSTPAFGASSTPAFGASSTPAFGASSTPAFGASSTPAFGASSTPAFGASSTPAFGASSTPAFGASSTPAFGASSTSAFGASSTPAFGASSTPAFGTSSTPAFGASSTPAFGASSTPAFGASAANSKPFGGFGTEASAQPSPSPSSFAGFGAPTTPASASSPTTFSFGANAGSAPTFSFGVSSAASPTTPTGAFAFGASSAASPGSPFNFGSKPAAASPPMFGTASPAPAFGSTPNGSDMEDTMADDGQMMASSPPPQQQTSLFGAPQTPGGTFQFGNPATPAATPSPVFGGFGNAGTPAGANPFASTPQQATPVANPFAASPQQAQPLNFGGGGFTLGSSGQDQGAKPAGRKFIKAKRAGSVKRK